MAAKQSKAQTSSTRSVRAKFGTRSPTKKTKAIVDVNYEIPRIKKRLKALEQDSHPPVDFQELFRSVEARLDALERYVRTNEEIFGAFAQSMRRKREASERETQWLKEVGERLNEPPPDRLVSLGGAEPSIHRGDQASAKPGIWNTLKAFWRDLKMGPND